MDQPPNPHLHLAAIAEMLRDLGYRGVVDEDHGIVATGAGGLTSTITSFAGSDIQLRCLIVAMDAPISPLALNAFNQRYRFAKTYVDDDGDVFLEADFFFSEGLDGAKERLHEIMKLWENFVGAFKDMLVAPNGHADRASLSAPA
jgi:hypothetical protein